MDLHVSGPNADAVYIRHTVVQRKQQRKRLRRKQQVSVLLLLLAGILLAAARPGRHAAQDSAAESAQTNSIAAVSTQAVPELTLCEADKDTLALGELSLVSNAHPCTFPDGLDLVSVYESRNNSYSLRSTDIQLCRSVMGPLNQLCQAFRDATGNGDLLVCAGYRSRQEQQELWDNAMAAHGEAYTRQYFSQPGASEHHTGLAVDFSLYNTAEQWAYEFDGSEASDWMLENCWNFGFIQRYPSDKVDITGISEETWHFRYVGEPHAALMHQKGLCLEEYIALLQEYPWDGEHLTEAVNGMTYELWYCPEDSVYVPTRGDYTLSGDNQGGCIVTLRR